MVKKVLLLISLIFLVDAVFATTHYLQVINPNDYDLTNFQIKLNLTKYNIEPPIAQITTLNGSNVPFCYEQPNGECNETESNIIWVKVPLIKAKDYTILKIIIDGTNGAVNGDQVFDFYDDFNDNIIDPNKWDGSSNFVEANGYIEIKYSTSLLYSKNYNIIDGIIESRMLLSSGGRGSIAFRITKLPTDFTNTAPSTAEEYSFNLRPPNNDIRLRKWYGGSEIILDSAQLAIPSDTWLSIKITVVGSSLTACFDNNCLSATDSTFSQGYIGLQADGLDTDETDYIRWDWIRVRKYADQDPIVRYSYQGSFSEGTPTQTSAEYNQTYLYVRQINVLPENSISISNAQIILELDTASLIAEGKMKSDCSDVYITYYDPLYGEIPAKFWVDPTTCNTKATRIYVKLPTISVNNDWIVNVYYGSPGAIPMWDPKNTFTFYVDLTNPSDISQNLIIRTEGTTSIDYTSNGLVVQTGSDGKVLIINK